MLRTCNDDILSETLRVLRLLFQPLADDLDCLCFVHAGSEAALLLQGHANPMHAAHAHARCSSGSLAVRVLPDALLLLVVHVLEDGRQLMVDNLQVTCM